MLFIHEACASLALRHVFTVSVGLDGEAEGSAVAVVVLQVDGAETGLDDLFADVQAEADALGVQDLGGVQLPEESEELASVFFLDAHA